MPRIDTKALRELLDGDLKPCVRALHNLVGEAFGKKFFAAMGDVDALIDAYDQANPAPADVVTSAEPEAPKAKSKRADA